VLRRSLPKKVPCPRGLTCSNNSPGGFKFFLISQKTRSYPSRIFKKAFLGGALCLLNGL